MIKKNEQKRFLQKISHKTIPIFLILKSKKSKLQFNIENIELSVTLIIFYLDI